MWLPTRRLVAVHAVRDLTGSAPRDITGYRWSLAGLLSLESGWPSGFRAVEVEVEHGFDECPPDLLPVLADRTNRRVMQESLGSRSVTYGVDGDRTIDYSLSLYRLGPRP